MCLEVVGQILEFPSDAEGMAIVEIEGCARLVSLVMLELEGTELVVGDWILSHTGLAVEVLPENEVQQILAQRRFMQRAYNAAIAQAEEEQ